MSISAPSGTSSGHGTNHSTNGSNHSPLTLVHPPQHNISSVTAWLVLGASVGAVSIILQTAHDPLSVNVGFSVLACILTWSTIPALSEIFVKAGLKGMDLAKKAKVVIPESMGMVAGLIYLVTMFLFVPFPFMRWFTAPGHTRDGSQGDQEELTLLTFPNHKLAELLSALLSILAMVFLGFADDVLDIRWRFKVPLPVIASIPLLMVYWVNFGVTFVVMPIPLRPYLGQLVDLGFLYYLYMGFVAVFCTHSINIMAGINGVEVGQSIVIACSIAVNDMMFIHSGTTNPATVEAHLFSLYFILPFIGVSLGLLIHNWYPSRVFIGDTYCYFAGMTFAVVGILAHYSKTLMLFFIPQVFNAALSAPQVFGLVPCPRHRVPKFNRMTNLMEPSRVVLDQDAFDADVKYISTHGVHKLAGGPSSSLASLKREMSALDPAVMAATALPPAVAQAIAWSDIPSKSQPVEAGATLSLTGKKKMGRLGLLIVKFLAVLGFTQIRYDRKTGRVPIEMTNLTILNAILVRTGPMHERHLTMSVMLVQGLCSLVAFWIRYSLVVYVYDPDVVVVA